MEGGTFGALGIRNAGIVHTDETMATIINCKTY
jgi:hypothetical protein